jgi:hypothetical protein
MLQVTKDLTGILPEEVGKENALAMGKRRKYTSKIQYKNKNGSMFGIKKQTEAQKYQRRGASEEH